jgi:predicted transcriptional regulator
MLLTATMDTMDELIDIMRAGRNLVGMSQEELAEAAGLSRQIVVRLEQHKDNVAVSVLTSVRSALEKAGVIFIPSTTSRGPGVALSRKGDAVRPVTRQATESEVTEPPSSNQEPEGQDVPPVREQAVETQAAPSDHDLATPEEPPDNSPKFPWN